MIREPIYFSQVTVCEIIKRGNTIYNKQLITFNTPSCSTTVHEFNNNDIDMAFTASHIFGRNKMRTEEKIDLLRKHFIVTKIEVGKIIGYKNIETKINPNDYQ